jgi:hypothetical protein
LQAAASSQLASFPRHTSTVWLGSCPSLLWRARRDSNTLHQRSQLAFLLPGGAGKRRRDESHLRRLELCRRLSLLRVVELLASREARTQWPSEGLDTFPRGGKLSCWLSRIGERGLIESGLALLPVLIPLADALTVVSMPLTLLGAATIPVATPLSWLTPSYLGNHSAKPMRGYLLFPHGGEHSSEGGPGWKTAHIMAGVVAPAAERHPRSSSGGPPRRIGTV